MITYINWKNCISYYNIIYCTEHQHTYFKVVLFHVMFQKGMTTTSIASYYLLGTCLAHPEVQTKIQREIDDKIGQRTPVLKDRPSLPYLEAVTLELLRFISHVPMSIAHKSVKDATIGEYSIPKNTQVCENANIILNFLNTIRAFNSWLWKYTIQRKKSFYFSDMDKPVASASWWEILAWSI